MRFTALSPSPNKKNANALCVAGVESGRGFGGRRKGRAIEERVRDACYKNPLLFISERPQIPDWQSHNE